MKILYIADDGTQFDDEGKCEDYEWDCNHPNLKKVGFFDSEMEPVNGDPFEDDHYSKIYFVEIHSEEELADFKEFVNCSGYCSYDSIDSIGMWKFKDGKDTFELLEPVKPRLIDANELIRLINEADDLLDCEKSYFLESIETCKTAFDKEKVKNEIRDIACGNIADKHCQEVECEDFSDCNICLVERYLDIIDHGGVNTD